MKKYQVLLVGSLIISVAAPTIVGDASKKNNLSVKTVYVKTGKVVGTAHKGTKITIKRSGKTLKKLTTKSSKFSAKVKGLKAGQKLTITGTYKKRAKAVKKTVKVSPTPVLSLTSHKTDKNKLILTGKTSKHVKVTVKNGKKKVGTQNVKGKTFKIKLNTTKLTSTSFTINAKNSTTAGSKTKKYTLNYRAPKFKGVADQVISKLNYPQGFSATSGVSAKDSRNKKLKVTVKGNVDINKNGQYIVTYTTTDNNKTKVTKKRTITVDNVAPKITGANDLSVNKSAQKFDSLNGVSASDANGKAVNITVNGNVNINKAGTYSLDYLAKDSAGNQTKVTRKVTVVNDIKPTIKGAGDTNVKKSAKSFDDLSGVTAVDGDGRPVKVTVNGKVNMTKAGSYTLTYTAKDSDGNTTNVTRKVTVINDVPPVISGNLTDITVPLNAPETAKKIFDAEAFKDISAVDSEGNALTSGSNGFKVDQNYDDTKSGTYTVTYTATDKDGNSVKATRNVIVKRFYATSIILNGVETLQPTQTSQFLATINPEGSQGDVKWTSSDTGVAKVNDKGIVTGVANGTAKITATTDGENGKIISATKNVTVDDTIKGYLSVYSSITIGTYSRGVSITFMSQDARPLKVTKVSVDDGTAFASNYTEDTLNTNGIDTQIPAQGSFSVSISSRLGWDVSKTKVTVTVQTEDGQSREFTSSLN